MSTVIVAAVLVGIIAAVILLLSVLDKKHKRTAMNQLLNAFRQRGAEHNLSFSSQEIFKDGIIGLDGVHRKLLVLERDADKDLSSFVIDLNEVKSCSVKKEYGTINSGDLKARKLEQYLKQISLHFVVYDKPSVDVVFYEHFENHVFEIGELENKAKHWEAILSKMIAPLKKTA